MNIIIRITIIFFLIVTSVSCQGQEGKDKGGPKEKPDTNKGGISSGDGDTKSPAFKPTGPFKKSKDKGQHQDPPDKFSNEVKIVFSPGDSKKCKECEEIIILQTVQMFVDGKRIRSIDYSSKQSSVMADGWTIPDIPSTPNTNEDGTHLDAPDPPKSHASISGSKEPGYTTPSGIDVNPSKADATLIDPPLAEGGDKGFKSLGNPNGYKTILLKLESCAYCKRGADAGKFYECITWKHTRTAKDAAAKPSGKGQSKFTGQTKKPSKGFEKAYQKFKKKFPN